MPDVNTWSPARQHSDENPSFLSFHHRSPGLPAKSGRQHGKQHFEASPSIRRAIWLVPRTIALCAGRTDFNRCAQCDASLPSSRSRSAYPHSDSSTIPSLILSFALISSFSLSSPFSISSCLSHSSCFSLCFIEHRDTKGTSNPS